MELTELGTKMEALETQTQELASKLASDPSPENQKAISGQIEELQKQMAPLVEERERVLMQESLKGMTAKLTTLENALTEMRKPMGFEFAGGVPASQKATEYDGSFYADVKAANKGNQKAIERIAHALGAESVEDIKAMSENSDAAGGYLVPAQRLDGLLEAREPATRLSSIFPTLDVISDTIQIASITSGMTAGWVAQLAEKPVSDLAFGQIEASVFTEAGLGVVANQLLRDSRANGNSIDNFITRDLVKRLDQVLEIAILNGSGTGQPKGLLQQAGTQPQALATWSDDAFLDAMIDGQFLLDNEGFQATHLVMHPRRWQRIAKFRNAETKEILVNGASPQGALPGKSIYGIPVITSRYVPTNLGAGTNQDAILMLDASEQLLMRRTGVTVDESAHVYFTSNQTVFRAERTIGFTAARYPKSIVVISGAGLVP